MRLLAYTRTQLLHILLRRRLLLAVAAFFFIAYRSVNGIQALSGSYGLPANVWDVLFYALGNSDTVYLVLAPLFLYLLGDLCEESRFGQGLMLRLVFRRIWWAGKLLTLFSFGFLYTSLVTLVILVVAVLRLPVQSDWSAMILANHTIEIGLPFDAIDSSPLLLLLQHLGLLFLGWTALGLLGMVASLALRRRFAAAFASLGTLLIGYIGITLTNSTAPYLRFLLLSYHLEFTPGWIPMRMVRFELSLVYWAAWLLLLGLTGGWLSLKQDDPGIRL